MQADKTPCLESAAEATPDFLMHEAVHIARGPVPLPAGSDCISLQDNLVRGPAAPDPQQHFTQRVDYWERTEGVPASKLTMVGAPQLWEQIGRRDEKSPIVLWTSTCWPEWLSLWWLGDALVRGEVPVDRLWLAESRSGENSGHEDLDRELIFHPEERLPEAFSRLKKIDEAWLRACTTLWRNYASSEADQFDASRRRDWAGFPKLRMIAEVYGFAFPRLQANEAHRLGLSELDTLVLGHLDRKQWLRPVDLIVNLKQNSPLYYYGEAFLLWRLRQWSEYRGAHAAVQSEERDGDNRYTSVAYRLRPRGQRLLEEGFDKVDGIPPLEVGGSEAYNSRITWVKREDTDSFSIVRYQD